MTKIELLAPGGDLDSIKAAISAGADAIYCGLDKFNARNRAENIVFADLPGILRLAHKNECQVFLTLNIIIVESEIPQLINLLNKLVKTKIDGVIIQDFGMFYLLSNYFPGLAIHASTQLTTHNPGQIQFLSQLKASRVNLSRELSLDEIRAVTAIGHENNILTEVFVHGSYCLSFSGLCYLSSVHGGKSGNRGRCSQPCRDQYLTTATGKDFPLNLKDNSAYADLLALAEAGVDSVKIEGRIKKFHYVYTVVNAWKKQLIRLERQHGILTDKRELYQVFNRDFSNGFLVGDINNSMFIDNSRDNSVIHRARLKGGCTQKNIEQAKRELYDLKTEIIKHVGKKIAGLRIEKAPLTITLAGKAGKALQVTITTPETSFVVLSEDLAQKNEQNTGQSLNTEILLKRFQGLDDTEYFIQEIDLENLQNDLFIPFKELNAIKNKILCRLHGFQQVPAPVALPRLKKPQALSIPVLSLLISSPEDLHLGQFIRQGGGEIYFQLPPNFANNGSAFSEIFKQDKVIPWFPSLLIGEDYQAAIEFLQELQPQHLVTNNTGIAYAAYQQGIAWIAGPSLNIVNSLSLLCLQKNFNCSGSFLSNEINKNQIKRITRPDDFNLHYSIYHPIKLLTSRQCLFQQVTGCQKNSIDANCMQECEKSSSIKNLKDAMLFIEKQKGNYHTLYNETNFLNTDIVTDLPNFFSSFLIDLRESKSNTIVEEDKPALIKLFADHLQKNPDSARNLRKCIHPTTDIQYKKGI
ncbi:MAG: U32 family peptidase [Candidatus Electrothrix sp. AR3]|nr:U32 family peptidase [Candidatus Electrothrix sp. AR3]